MLEFEMNKQMETFSFSPPLNLFEEVKWLLAVTSFETTNTVYIITDENNSFSITIPGLWQTKPAEKTIDELEELSELKCQNSIKRNVKKLGKGQTKKY